MPKPDTILSWFRKLVAQKFDGSKHCSYPGRPRIDAEIESLIVQMARENSGRGYDGLAVRCLTSVMRSPIGRSAMCRNLALSDRIVDDSEVIHFDGSRLYADVPSAIMSVTCDTRSRTLETRFLSNRRFIFESERCPAPEPASLPPARISLAPD